MDDERGGLTRAGEEGPFGAGVGWGWVLAGRSGGTGSAQPRVNGAQTVWWPAPVTTSGEHAQRGWCRSGSMFGVFYGVGCAAMDRTVVCGRG